MVIHTLLITLTCPLGPSEERPRALPEFRKFIQRGKSIQRSIQVSGLEQYSIPKHLYWPFSVRASGKHNESHLRWLGSYASAGLEGMYSARSLARHLSSPAQITACLTNTVQRTRSFTTSLVRQKRRRFDKAFGEVSGYTTHRPVVSHACQIIMTFTQIADGRIAPTPITRTFDPDSKGTR